MNLQDAINRHNQASTAKTVRLKAWKHTSGRDINLIIGDILPVLSGIGIWIGTGSIKQGLIWGGVTFVICAYLIVPLLSGPWLVGLSLDEYRQAVHNFCYNADNRSYITMAVGKRRFRLFCEVFGDSPEIFGEAATYLGVILPRKYWDDIYDEQMRAELEQAGATEIIEKNKNIYVRGPKDSREPDTELALINYLMEKTETSLKDFSTKPVTSYAVHVFSDLPPKTAKQKIGIDMK